MNTDKDTFYGALQKIAKSAWLFRSALIRWLGFISLGLNLSDGIIHGISPSHFSRAFV
jgi:hypothetical protein